MEIRAWLRGSWETIKAIVYQKLMSYLQIDPSLRLPNRLCGLNVIITGATSGIGLDTARELAFAGAHVMMACRNTEAALKIAQQWKEEALDPDAGQNPIMRTNLEVEVMEIDLLSLTSVRQFATEWDQHHKPLHILINNAGVLQMREPQGFSEDGVEKHVQVNHVSPALLTLLLLPSMLKADAARIVNVNSVAHQWGVVDFSYWNNRVEEHKFYGPMAYGSSKLVNLMFLKALASKVWDQGLRSIECVAVHPGVVQTNLIPDFKKRSFWMLDSSEGARNVIYCATSAHVRDKLVKGFVYYTTNYKVGKISPEAESMEACFNVWAKTLQLLNFNANEIIPPYLIDL